MTHAGPLPGIGKAPGAHAAVPLLGWWRAFVDHVEPLVVSVPAFTGTGSGIGKVEIVPGLVVKVGDRVWVVPIEGNRHDLLIVAARTG